MKNKIKSDREKKIDFFLKQIKTQKEWENEINIKIQNFKKQYSEQLEDYEYVQNLFEFNNLKLGGYIRYITFNNKFRWGGILLKKHYDKKTNRNLMIVANKNYKRNIVSFDNNYIFYKSHRTLNDNYRKLFISYLKENDK